MITKKNEPGTVNMKEITESIKSIEIYTNQYKKKRITTEKYIQFIHENLARLTNERDYKEYLKNIGQ